MTASTVTRVLYPTGPGWADVCALCFKPNTDTAITTDRRVCPPSMPEIRTCRDCWHAKTTGGRIAYPLRDELPCLLENWARWDINGEVSEELVGWMLPNLLPTLNDRDIWWGDYKGALLEYQERCEPGFDLASVPEVDRDPDRLEADSLAKIGEAIEALMEGARPDPLPEFLTVRQTARLYCTDARTVRWWAREGDIEATKVGREWRIHPFRAVEQFGEDRVRRVVAEVTG